MTRETLNKINELVSEKNKLETALSNSDSKIVKIFKLPVFGEEDYLCLINWKSVEPYLNARLNQINHELKDLGLEGESE